MTNPSSTDETHRATLVRPPPLDPSKAPIENVLDLTSLSVIGPEIYTNTRPLWHPPGARGIYGGAVIAQCLSAAQRTVPPDFAIHSMHAYFVLAGDSEIPVLYHVEDVRSGKSFATRTVQARQKGKAIFTTTLSFVRRGSGGAKTVMHEIPPPEGVEWPGREEGSRGAGNREGGSPFETLNMVLVDTSDPNNASQVGQHQPWRKRTRQFLRAKGKISDQGGQAAHLNALAYMSDSYFIGTVARVHGLGRPIGFRSPVKGVAPPSSSSSSSTSSPFTSSSSTSSTVTTPTTAGPSFDADTDVPPPQIGMMVSLDHTIYFHNPDLLRADEWLLSEMESPQAGDGRGLVVQHIWGSDRRLVATCVQEGVVRLKPDDHKGAKL